MKHFKFNIQVHKREEEQKANLRGLRTMTGQTVERLSGTEERAMWRWIFACFLCLTRVILRQSCLNIGLKAGDVVQC